MTKIKRLLFLQFILLFPIMLSAPAAHAAILSTAPISYELSNELYSSAYSEFVNITPFDPALGTLDSVNVSISGVLVVTGLTGNNFTIIGLGQYAPLPFVQQVTVTQDFSGLAGLFDFSTPAKFEYVMTAPGTPVGFSFATSFNYNFSFDWITDTMLGGSTYPSFTGATVPPASILGYKDNFIDSLSFIDQLLVQQTVTASGQALPLSLSANVFGGLMTVEYEYTPSTSVPEPSLLFLFGSGLAGLIGFRRRLKGQ